MTQGITDRIWQAEARTQETRQLIRDVKRITRRKFTAEEKIRIVLVTYDGDHADYGNDTKHGYCYDIVCPLHW